MTSVSEKPWNHLSVSMAAILPIVTHTDTPAPGVKEKQTLGHACVDVVCMSTYLCRHTLTWDFRLLLAALSHLLLAAGLLRGCQDP